MPMCKTADLGSHNGAWVRDANETRKKWVCCGWDGGRAQLPEVAGLCASGANLASSGYRFSGDNALFALAGGHACECDAYGGTLRTVSERERWTWKPSSCTLHEFCAPCFCRILGNRKFLILGDSYAQQFSSTIMNSVRAGKCAHQFVSALSDRLVAKGGFVGRGKDWRVLVSEEQPEIVMLSLGAHIKDIQEYSDLIKDIADGIKALKSSNIRFIWRTLHYPHDYCTLSRVPEENARGSQYNWRTSHPMTRSRRRRCGKSMCLFLT